ncbi:MAG: UDP-galactopyranose mutase [Verrucomicrobiales bacterium]|nr:UDP-galactopyranose mutase [Verrucomicrobiales bacterium]
MPVMPVLTDFVVFSHLRWDFVFQRPQHLLTRCAADHRVFYIEEPVFGAEGTVPFMETGERANGLVVAVPHLPSGMPAPDVDAALGDLVDRLFAAENITDFMLWYYTPMALPFTRHLKPLGVVYDCMDELSLFKGAPPQLLPLERELFARADIVFTGGQTLFEHKRALHGNIHAFPSSIEAHHFGRARDAALEEAGDQRHIPGPRIGFIGVIDERMDLDILEGVAAARPGWSVVVVGPVVKVDPETLPRLPNIHYLGPRPYQDLPAYLKGWDAAILPFALNDSTRFISPTKTPEYLAAGVPVVSTPIRDVVTPYGDRGLVLVADTPEAFTKAIERQLTAAAGAREAWLGRVDAFLASGSWEITWGRMLGLIHTVVGGKSAGARAVPRTLALPPPVPGPSAASVPRSACKTPAPA